MLNAEEEIKEVFDMKVIKRIKNGIFSKNVGIKPLLRRLDQSYVERKEEERRLSKIIYRAEVECDSRRGRTRSKWREEFLKLVD